MRRRPVLWVSIALLAAFVYEGILRPIVHGWVVLPLIPGGLPGLTAILALCSVTHAWYALGGRTPLFFFASSAVIAWAYEQAGVLTGFVYGPYHYTSYLGEKLGEVPLVIPMAWFMMIYPSYVIANLALSGRPSGTAMGLRNLLALSVASAATMTAWDLVIDPILSGPQVRAWVWEGGGRYFGVPLHNYAGWLLTTFTVYLVFRRIEQRFAAEEPGGRRAATGADPSASVAVLPVAIYLLMLVSDLVSGVAPAGLAIIGPVVMGAPVVAAAWQLRTMPIGGRPPGERSRGRPRG